jgi:hypothetical protein
MKHLLEFTLDGGSIFVEAEDSPSEKNGRALRGQQRGGAEQDRAQRFVDAVARVKPAAEAVLRTFQELQTPDEISLEFGVKFNAKASAILASVDSEATFKVSLKWKRKEAAS